MPNFCRWTKLAIRSTGNTLENAPGMQIEAFDISFLLAGKNWLSCPLQELIDVELYQFLFTSDPKNRVMKVYVTDTKRPIPRKIQIVF